MKRLEYFSEVMKVVTELLEVNEVDVLGKSRELDVVDARWMVMHLLREKGYQTKQISPLMCKPERTVNHALSNFEDRVKYSLNGLGNTLAIAKQMLSNIQ